MLQMDLFERQTKRRWYGLLSCTVKHFRGRLDWQNTQHPSLRTEGEIQTILQRRMLCPNGHSAVSECSVSHHMLNTMETCSSISDHCSQVTVLVPYSAGKVLLVLLFCWAAKPETQKRLRYRYAEPDSFLVDSCPKTHWSYLGALIWSGVKVLCCTGTARFESLE